MRVAGNVGAPASVLAALAGDADIEVRRAVAVNRSTPEAVLATLENDDDEVVQECIEMRRDAGSGPWVLGRC